MKVSAVHLDNCSDSADGELPPRGQKVPSQVESKLTLVHVPGEASQDSAQGCRVKEVHGAEQEAAEELVVEHGGSLDGALPTQGETASLERCTWRGKQTTREESKNGDPEWASHQSRSAFTRSSQSSRYCATICCPVRTLLLCGILRPRPFMIFF